MPAWPTSARTVIPFTASDGQGARTPSASPGLGNIEVDCSGKARTSAWDCQRSRFAQRWQPAANNLAVNMSGLGSANLAGEVNKQAVNVSGAGSYYARDLRSRRRGAESPGLAAPRSRRSRRSMPRFPGAATRAARRPPLVAAAEHLAFGSIEGTGQRLVCSIPALTVEWPLSRRRGHHFHKAREASWMTFSPG